MLKLVDEASRTKFSSLINTTLLGEHIMQLVLRLFGVVTSVVQQLTRTICQHGKLLRWAVILKVTL